MNTGDTSLLVATIGVVGTLGAAALTQVRADRLRRVELAHAAEERSRADARAEADVRATRLREDFIERRACYARCNGAARQLATALVNYRHALKAENPASAQADAAAELETQRAEFRDVYHDAQMIVNDNVLATLSLANREMNAQYGLLRRIASSRPRKGETLEQAAAAEDALWNRLGRLRTLMRRDLGIHDDESTT